MPRQDRTPLEKFFDDRDHPSAIKRPTLDKDLGDAIDEILSLVGGDAMTAQGALRYLMLGPLRSVAADLEAMQRLDQREKGRLKVAKEEMGSTMRALVTPNFGLNQSRVPKPMIKRQTGLGEFLYEFEEPWEGKDFIITDGTAAVFRAWSRKVHEPREGLAELAPASLRRKLNRLEIPEREESAPLLRLCLPVGDRRRRSGKWIAVQEQTGLWNDGEFSVVPTLPSTYVASLLRHTGLTYGVNIQEKGRKLHICWRGAFLVRELIDPAEWGATS